MRLLLVDDEIFAVQGIVDSVNWKRVGIDEVLTASSMKSAIEILGSNKIDIALCDIEMPNGSGIDLVWYIKNKISYEVLCIFLTAHSNFDFAQQAIRQGCFDYILKPAKPETIEEVLIKAVEQIDSSRKDETYKNYGQLYVKNVIGADSENNASPEDIVESCVRYIREHIQESLSVESLAVEHYISADYLTRLFKKKFGQGLAGYIKDQRMFLAKELLENTDLSVTMISAKVGYENYSAFITSFKKYCGMPPREYRQMYRSENTSFSSDSVN